MEKAELTRLYDLIPSARWATRDELHSATGWYDRKIRDGISELRKNPKTMVVSSSSGKGYKRPTTVEELTICLNENRSRVEDLELQQMAILQAISDMEAPEEPEEPEWPEEPEQLELF